MRWSDPVSEQPLVGLPVPVGEHHERVELRVEPAHRGAQMAVVLAQVHLLEPDRLHPWDVEAGHHQVHARPRAEQKARAPAQPPRELDVGPQVEARDGAVGSRHEHARKRPQHAPQPSCCAARTRAPAAVVERGHRHAGGEGAEERDVAIARARDDLHLVSVLDQVLGEVEGGTDRAAHAPRRPQQDEDALVRALEIVGAWGRADVAQQRRAHELEGDALGAEDDPGHVTKGPLARVTACP